MTYEEKGEKFESTNARVAFNNKTSFDNLPIKFSHGSSSRSPDEKGKGGVVTSDITLWVKFCNHDWFKPYGGFYQDQIQSMIDICHNDLQIVSLMELLSANKEYKYEQR